MEDPQRVAMIEKMTNPKGTEIIMVVMLKGMASRGSMPLTYWWCAQTMKPKKPAMMRSVDDGSVSENRLAAQRRR